MKDNTQKMALKGIHVLVAIPDGPDGAAGKERLDFCIGLEELGLKVTYAKDAAGAKEILQKGIVDLAIIAHDRGQGGIDGIEILKASHGFIKQPGIILLAKKAVIEDAVSAMQLGALDFLCQPVDIEVLELAIKRAMTRYAVTKLKRADRRGDLPCQSFEKTKKEDDDPYRIITSNPRIEKILSQASRVAHSRASVLILGESGTGKELLARYIHRKSQRKGPFVAVNCAALPETLLESELFGHEKGAFSGAVSRRLGKFEMANGGTLLLDEITEMALPLQAKILRVLQEGEVDRLGGLSPVKVDVRIIATTNRDIKSAITSGIFREDLYFRLNVITFMLPPLRERVEDIVLLSEHFLKMFSKEYGKCGLKFADNVLDVIQSMKWPGNIRELRNAIERGVLLACGDTVTIKDILGEDADIAAGRISDGHHDTTPQDEVMDLDTLERNMIAKALLKTTGNRTHAAKLLGISVRTLRNKLSEYRQRGIVL
ncbi:MAG: sigma-54-dependent transcriptional regulator [Dissulfurimicrobium sp.]|uniref:sigma-54-dependent transcriptional regulator n=1 Tax=Dissulfurimicrobium sp. TaxID=2022436 RepID=UPI0040490F8A